MLVKLTPIQKKNLLTFLSRTRLEGHEAPALIELVSIINSAEDKKEEVEEHNSE
jgi:hypothetical protein